MWNCATCFFEIPTTFKSENTTSFKSHLQYYHWLEFHETFKQCPWSLASSHLNFLSASWELHRNCGSNESYVLHGSTRSLDATNLWGRKAGLANQHGVPTWGWHPSNLLTGSLRASLSWDPGECKTSGAAAKNAPLVLCNGAWRSWNQTFHQWIACSLLC